MASLMFMPSPLFAKHGTPLPYGMVQEELVIRGKVVSDLGAPIAGVSVRIKGKTISTSTDEQGNFSLKVPSNSVLEFTYVGYEKQEQLIQNDQPLEVMLLAEDKTLDEVVVIGYGTQSRKETTGSLTSVKGDDVAQLPVQSFDASLTGRSSGVQVNTSAGVLNQAPVFKIRGTNSLSLSTYPLIVIDGVPAFDNNDDSGPSYASNNPLSSINPADIESIDIAKDAAATSIYGSRAANGVVFITTKKGKRGTTKINYDGWVGFTSAIRLPDLLNAAEYIEIKNEALRNDGTYDEESNYYGFSYDANGNVIDTRWADYVYQTGTSHSHNVNVSGASDKTSYYGSVGYSNQEGIFQKNGFDRKSVMFNVDNQTTDWLKLGMKINYVNENNLAAMATGVGSSGGFQGSSSSGTMARVAIISSPIVGPYNNDGTYNYTSNGYIGLMDNDGHLNQSRLGFYNPVVSLANNYSNNHLNNVQSNAYVQIQPLSWLTAKSVYGIDYRYINYENYSSPISGEAIATNGSASSVNSNRQRWVWTNTVTADKKFGEHSVNLLLGQEQQRTTGNRFGLRRTGQTDPYYTNIQGGWQNVFDYSTDNAEVNNYLFSLFSRLQYDYKKRYFITANLRQDEYSALGLNNKKGVFWGVSAGWDMAAENFWQTAGLGTAVNTFKLRSSYGKVGNVGGLGDFGALNTYSAVLYGGQAGLEYTVTGNPDLKWETSKKFDVGVDFGLFDNLLTGSIGYYKNAIDGLIFAVPLPPSVGIPNGTNNSILQNVGEMANNGFEFTVNSTPVQKAKFRWNTSLNLTTNNNEVVSLANGVSSIITGSLDGMNITTPGEPAGMLYAIRTGGVDPATGRRIFIDGQGRKVLYQQSVTGSDGVTYQWEYEDGSRAPAITPAADASPYKPTAPNVYGGWTNTFSYGQLDLSVLLTYQLGGYMMNGTQATMRDLRFWNNSTDVLRRWQNPGEITDIPRVVNNDNVSNGNTLPLDANISSTDYLRLKNVMLSYVLPSALSTRMGLSNIRAYVSGQNLAMWTKYAGFDPDITTNGNNAIQQGIDKNQAPNARTVTVGLSVGF
ncbi:SusC/RagA family TonB-linked outer membrane protein [Parapedobacter sp. DT-150]|uniref:SusC/RagA family TonB-linked outer membrane protein n=1 Tax=Parapedobacter sp. DT-150 TaxID=3396162 RepID=UPI003F1D0E78